MKKINFLILIFFLSSIGSLSIISCKKASTPPVTTNNNTTTPPPAATTCYPISYAYSNSPSANINYNLTLDGQNRISTYQLGDYDYYSIGYQSNGGMIINVSPYKGSSFQYYKIMAVYSSQGKVTQTYWLPIGKTTPDVRYTYQVDANNLTYRTMSKYRNNAWVDSILTEWTYSGNVPIKETNSHYSLTGSLITDNIVSFTFDNSNRPFSGKLLTKEMPYYSALDFAPHNVTSAVSKDHSNNILSTTNYTYTYNATNYPTQIVSTVTGGPTKTEYYNYNCK